MNLIRNILLASLCLSARLNAQSNDPIILLPPTFEAAPEEPAVTNESPRLAVEAAVYLLKEPKPDVQLAVKRFGMSNTQVAAHAISDLAPWVVTVATNQVVGQEASYTSYKVVRVTRPAHWQKECADCGKMLKGVDRISRHFTDGGTNFQERVVTFQCDDGFIASETYTKPLRKTAPMRRVSD